MALIQRLKRKKSATSVTGQYEHGLLKCKIKGVFYRTNTAKIKNVWQPHSLVSLRATLGAGSPTRST